MTILYSCNSNYVNQTMISICSIMKCYRDREKERIKFLIVGDSLSVVEKDKIQSLVKKKRHLIRFFELSEISELEECITDGIHPKSVYAKLFPDRFTEEKRILYLDSDVIANAVFSELFSIDLEGAVIAGVRMPYSKGVLREQGIKGEVFICDGVVLIDVEQWRRKQLSEKALEYIRCCKGRPKRMSESVINFICEKSIFVLPPCYNLMPQLLVFYSQELEQMHRITGYYSYQEIEEAKESPVFIHFMRELYNRPWLKKSPNCRWNHPYQRLYQHYQRGLKIPIEEKEELSIRTKMLRYLYEFLPFSIFLMFFLRVHRD